MKSVVRSVFILGITSCANAQVPDTSPLIRSTRPLGDASVRLEHRLGKPVTYEESLLVWTRELDVRDVGATRKWDLFPKMQGLILPATTADPVESVQRAIDAYHVNSEGTRFDVVRSEFGLHIVPRRMHNERGELVDAHSLLDARIAVFEAERTPLQHLMALGDAVSAVTGTKLEISASPGNPKGFDNAYRPATPRFSWGAAGKIARDALIELLEGSATTFTWRLNCQPSSQAVDRFCVLNLTFLTVLVTGPEGMPALRTLEFDRCSDCPSLR